MEQFEHVRDLEIKLHLESTRKDKKLLNDLIDDEFIEIGTSGNLYLKKDICQRLPSSEFVEISSFDFEMREICNNVIQIIYKTEMNVNDKKIVSFRSSLWKNNGRWQMIFHQGSKLS